MNVWCYVLYSVVMLYPQTTALTTYAVNGWVVEDNVLYMDPEMYQNFAGSLGWWLNGRVELSCRP